MSSTADGRRIPFWDPHFHVWDVQSGPHDTKALGCCCDAAKGGWPVYTLEQYEAHIAEAEEVGIHGIGGAIVEALPTSDEPIEECKWLIDQVAQHRKKHPEQSEGRSYELVGRISLTRDDTAQRLKECTDLTAKASTDMRVCGLRQIINFEPTWPHVDENLAESNSWLKAFDQHVAGCFNAERTGTPGLRVWEIHCNPYQLPAIVEKLVVKNPHVNFVLNHLGCLKIDTPGKKGSSSSTPPEEAFAQWNAALSKFAQCPNAFLKISGASYVQPYEERQSESKGEGSYPTRAVKAALDHFGSKRLMVSSNYPVSHCSGCTPKRFFSWLLNDTVLGGLTFEEKEDVFAHNAIRVYTGGSFAPHTSSSANAPGSTSSAAALHS